MKTQDFEDAILKMDSRIELDEVKINKGHVRRFYGHIDHRLIMWDEKGRGYSFFFRQEINHTTHEKLPESFYVRNNKYDIHFENRGYEAEIRKQKEVMPTVNHPQM